MRAKSYQGKCIVFFIVPYNQEIALYVTFHTTRIFTFKGMLPIFLGKRYFVPEHIENYPQFIELPRLIEKFL